MKNLFLLILFFVFSAGQIYAGGSMCTGAHEWGQNHQEYFLDWDTDGGDGSKNEEKVLKQAQAKYKSVGCKTFGYYPTHGVFVVITNGKGYALGADVKMEHALKDAEIAFVQSRLWNYGEDYKVVEKHSY